METIWDSRKMQSDVLLLVPDRTMDGLETKAVVRTQAHIEFAPEQPEKARCGCEQ